MVKIIQDMLTANARHAKRRTNESVDHFLKRLTHIYLQDRNIEEIDNLALCKNLSVLYLYNNNITVIKNLSFASTLTHLYLQNNQISHMSGLKYLQRLTKLYLGHNSITVIEGLDSNFCLAELHVEYQSLPEGEKLLFDPRTLSAISGSLAILNISGNGIDELTDLKSLRNLNQLVAEENQLDNWVDLSEALFDWKFLYKLDITGNPVCGSREKKWLDKLIIMSKSLVMINKKEVTESTRLFVQSLYAKKEERKRARAESKSKTKFELWEKNSGDYLSSQGASFSNMTDMLDNVGSHRTVSLRKSRSEKLPPLEQVDPRKSQFWSGNLSLEKVPSEARGVTNSMLKAN